MLLEEAFSNKKWLLGNKETQLEYRRIKKMLENL